MAAQMVRGRLSSDFGWIRVWSALGFLAVTGCVRFEPHPLAPAETAARFESRALSAPSFKMFLERNRTRPLDSWPLQSWDFESLNLALLYFHPSLDVARAQWQTAAAGQKTAASRPNPTIGLAPGYDISASGGVSPWISGLTFDWPVETAGKRGHRQAQARRLSESARLNILATAWQLRGQLRARLIEFAATRQRHALLDHQKSVQEKIVHSLEQRVQAGAAARSELTLVRIALDRIQLDLADAQRQVSEARVRVAEAIGLPAKALEGVELTYDLSARPTSASEWTSDAARDHALQSRADLLSLLAEYAASQSALQLEIARQYPDVHLGPGYQFDQGDHKFTLALTAELPLLNQNQGPIAQAEARRAEIAARFQALQAKISAELDRAIALFQVSEQNLNAAKSLASAQRQRHELVQAQLQAGAADQLDLLNSQMELDASELLELAARIHWQQALGALEEAFQRPADSAPSALIEQSPVSQVRKEAKP